MDETSKKKTTITAGVAVLLVAVGFAAWRGLEDNKTCQIAGAGVGLIASAITEGKSAGVIAGASIGGIFIPELCESAIEAFIESPAEPVTLEVETPAGTSTVTTTGSEVLNPDPQPDLASLIRRIQCDRYTSAILFDWCLKGLIEPLPA